VNIALNASRPPSTLGDYFTCRQEPGRAGLPVPSVTMHDGLVHRDVMYRRMESTLTPDEHLLVRKGDIAYNMMRMWQSACGLAEFDGIVSPAYVVLTPKSGINNRFAYHWLKTPRMLHLLWAYSHGLTEDRLRLYFDDFRQIPASAPSLQNQERIASVLDACSNLIEKTEVSLSLLKSQKLSLMQRLIPSEWLDDSFA